MSHQGWKRRDHLVQLREDEMLGTSKLDYITSSKEIILAKDDNSLGLS
jgi:hypothetical protein